MTTEEMVVDVSQDWLLACSVQERFMQAPSLAHCRVDYAASCQQMRALGGDCYEFSCQPDGRLAMLVGDASGKGVAAALMMASVQASLRMAAVFTGSDLAALLRVVNAQACASTLAGRYVTLFYGLLDGDGHTLRFVNAGHTPPVVLRRDGSIEWLEPGGPPVGLFPDAHWQVREVRLGAGDRLVATTDGVTEAASPSGDEWGMAGLLQAAAERESEPAGDVVAAILDAMNDFSAGIQADDATVAVLRIR